MKRILLLVTMLISLTSQAQQKSFSQITPGTPNDTCQIMAVKDSNGVKYDRLLNATDLRTYFGGSNGLQNVIFNGDTSSLPAYFTDGLGHKLAAIGFASSLGGSIICGSIDSIYPATPTGNFIAYGLDSIGIQASMTNGATVSSVSLSANRDSLKVHGGGSYTQTLQVKNGIIADLSDIAAIATPTVTLQQATTAGNTTTNQIKISGAIDTMYINDTLIAWYRSGAISFGLGKFGSTTQPQLRMHGSGGGLAAISCATAGSGTYIIDDYGSTGQHFAMKSDSGIFASRYYVDSGFATIPTAHPAGTPTFVYGAAAGSPTITATVSGDDASGFITFNTGAAPTSSGTVFTMTFNTSWHNATVQWFNTVGGTAAGNALINGSSAIQTNRSASVTFSVSGTALSANTGYTIGYIVINGL